MPYVVDGHNLIPKIPGLSLSEVEDEIGLLELLQEFCRISRKQVEVFFDNSPPGGVRVRNLGMVTARFVRQGVTADEAIRQRLLRLGRAARNWVVVSSDLAIQSAARSAQARFQSSESFAHQVMQVIEGGPFDKGRDAGASLSQREIDEWMELFERPKNQD